MEIKNFVSIDSVHGTFIVNRHCYFQAEALIKTGRTHIEPELSIILSLIDCLPDGAIIIDGGANIGFVTLPIAQRIKDRNSKLLSFEPQRMLFYSLCGTIALNDLYHVFPYNLALGKEEGFADMPVIDYGAEIDYGCTSIKTQSTETPQTKVVLNSDKIPVVTIDSLNLPRLDFINLDLEGYEINALTGGINTIKQFRPLMWIEYILDGKLYHEDIKNSLISQGLTDYSYFIMDSQNMLCMPNDVMKAMSPSNQAILSTIPGMPF